MGYSHSVGVLFADDAQSGLNHNYFAPILDSFQRTMEKNGYAMTFLNANKECTDRPAYVEQTVQRQLEGILIACIDFQNPEVLDLTMSGIPVVTIDQQMPGAVMVASDNDGGIRLLTEYLIEMGHKKIAYIKGEPGIVTETRTNGFLEICKKNGIEIPENYLISSSFCDTEKAAFYTEKLLRMNDQPTCIMYSDDLAAIGGINIMRARGMRIPKDISIAGYDGVPLIAQFTPKLTTVKQNTKKIGEVSANKLLQLIENPDGADKTNVLIETSLEKGKTVSRQYY